MRASLKGPLLAFGSIAIAGSALAFIAASNLGNNLIYYWTPKEMLAQGERAHGPTIRLGGVVEPGSLSWNPTHTTVSFRVSDALASNVTSVAVATDSTPPQMFREGIGVVVEGTYDKGAVFRASRLMVNHGNDYQPPKDEAQFQAMMKSLQLQEAK